MKPVLRVCAAAFAAAAVALPVAQAGAATPPPAVHELQPYVNNTPAAVRSFWTLERMRAVTVSPGDPEVTEVAGKPDVSKVWSGGGAVTKTAGRVFFRVEGTDLPSSCSANVVSGNVVVTAGHCLKEYTERKTGTGWDTRIYDWLFVPGFKDPDRTQTSDAYFNGTVAPYGRWAATRRFVPQAWFNNGFGDFKYDFGAALVTDPTRPAARIADVVGTQAILFNGPVDQAMYSFGYPKEKNPWHEYKTNFWGGKMIFSKAAKTEHSGWTGAHIMYSAQAGGSSGGPWFQNFNPATGTGTQVGVNSQFDPAGFTGPRMTGTYLGNEAKAVYDYTTSIAP